MRERAFRPERRRAPGLRWVWLAGAIVAVFALTFVFAAPAAAQPTPEEVAAEVAACHAGGGDLSDCIDAVTVGILVGLGVAEPPPPPPPGTGSGNPPIPPVPPVP